MVKTKISDGIEKEREMDGAIDRACRSSEESLRAF
jgi:hypothetical protein